MIQKKEIPADRHVFSGTAGAFFTGKAAAAVGGFLPDRGKVQMAAGGKTKANTAVWVLFVMQSSLISESGAEGRSVLYTQKCWGRQKRSCFFP